MKKQIIWIIVAGVLTASLLALWLRHEPRAVDTDTELSGEIRLGYLRIGSDLPYFVAAQEGLFEKNGITVRAERMGDSNQAMEALLQGEIQVTDIIGSSVVLSAALDHRDEFGIYMMSAADADHRIHKLIASRESGISDATDLVNKRLAVFPGSQMRAYVELFLGGSLTADELQTVELVPLSPPQQLDAMERRQVDAVLTLEPTGTQLLENDDFVLILDNVLYESISSPRPFVTAFGVVDKRWLAQNGELFERFVDAYREASEIIRLDPARARLNMARALNLDREVASKVDLYNYPVVPDIQQEDIKFTVQLMFDEGVLSELPDYENLILRNDR